MSPSCSSCQNSFTIAEADLPIYSKLAPQELDFYKKENLPTPTRHPNERYKDRLNLKLPYRLWERTCKKCNAPIQRLYAPERSEKVYCENCYFKEIY